MVTQSGGFGFGVVSIAEQHGVGFNFIISTGNETDVSAMELIEYFVERDDVEAVVAYLEGSTEGRRLLEIGVRALERGKPVLMWKVGNSQSGRCASISHTARLTADQTLFQRAIDAGGFIEIGDTDDLVDVAQILRHHKKPKGNRVAVITAAGGAGVLMADQCSFP
jgi:acetyltransferase